MTKLTTNFTKLTSFTMANDGDELVIEQTGPDFMLDELERYMRASAFSDLSIQCRDQIQQKKFNFSVPLKIT